ncbi:hypothetical protein, partial [uncultured Pseudomonas sp.]|uniref:hypothetical protein n=1 Tax=uncultured Pseudomonas sp. TaxID=114707 RepID=UPI002588467F
MHGRAGEHGRLLVLCGQTLRAGDVLLGGLLLLEEIDLRLQRSALGVLGGLIAAGLAAGDR